VGLLLLLGIGSLFYQGGRTIYQNACLLRGVRLAKKAIALADDGKYKAAVRHLNRAQLLVKSAGRPYDQTACLIIMGHLRLRLGDYPGAIRAYEKSLRVSEKAGLHYIDRYALTGMGVAHERMGDNHAAREAYEAAEKMLTERHGDDEKGFVQERIEQLDRILGQWLKSV
jgi:tetratricopeptide (TPR) repeat protein